MNLTDSTKKLSPLVILFVLEGLILQFNTSLNNYGNTIFATNLNATDSQIGLIQLIPNIIAFIALIPLGMLADRSRSAKTVPAAVLIVMSLGYFGLGCVPSLGNTRIRVFFTFLALTVGGMAIYNAQWQAFFGELIDKNNRNSIFTVRNKFMFALGVAVPLICGFFIRFGTNHEEKLFVLRVFYYVSAIFTLIQALIIMRMPGGARSEGFLLFFIPVVLFYMTWHLDWSVWYLGQINYVGMNETHLSVNNSIGSIGQLIGIGVMSRLVDKKGPDHVMLYCIGALALIPLSVVITLALPAMVRPAVFIAFIFLFNIPQGAVNLCTIQMLLNVVPERNRSLIVNIYIMAITLSNSVIPWLGVKIYILLGASLTGFCQFLIMETILRIFVLILFVLRNKKMPEIQG